VNAKIMDKRVVRRWVKAARLIAALGFAACIHAAPPPGRSPRAVPEEILLRGTDSEGNELALRVPVNILLAQLQQPGSGANINLNQIGGTSVSSTLYDSGNNALKVNCIVGCTSAGGFTDNGAFTTGSTSVTNVSGLFNDTARNLTSGNAGAIRATTDRMLFVNIGKIGGAVPALTGSSLNVNCTGGCSSSAGFADNSAFTAGTATETNVGGVFNDGLTALSSGNAAAARITPNRGVHVNLRNNAGTEIATSSNPLRIDPTGTTTQPVSGTVTTTPPANASTNVAQFGGTNVVTGTGVGGVGIPRVTVSNDSSILGTKTNNNAAPGATNFGILPALANAAAPSWTEGNQVALSVDLAGNNRTIGSLADNGVAAATNRVGTAPSIYQTSYLNGTAATQGRNGALSQGTDGLLWTAALPSIRPASYVASAAFVGSSTTDNAVMPGNASNTVLVTAVKVSCTQTTAGTLTLTLIKRSSADTSGTSAAMTAVPDDSNYAAAASAPLSYTGAGPTVGGVVGNVDNYKLGCIATGTASPNDIYILNRRQKPVVLRGTAQQLAVNFGNAAITGGNITVTFEWIETATITP
jgi:hypothetical protein